MYGIGIHGGDLPSVDEGHGIARFRLGNEAVHRTINEGKHVMKIRNFLFGATLVVVTATITSTVVSQDKGKADEKAQAKEQEMLKKWMEFATPGANHKLLDPRVGKWNGEVTMWHDKNSPPETSKCTTEAKWIYDGRYLAETVEGNFDGQTFLGQSWTGYDNMKKKFVWVWIDNMGTGLMNAEGTYEEKDKAFKFTYEHPNIMKGKYEKGHSVDKWIDNDHWVMEMHGVDAEGKEMKTMEIKYTRVK
jgi:hypothetical protein